MKVDKTSFAHVNMAEVAPTQQQSLSRESSAPFQQIRSAIEQGHFITRATRGEHGSPTFPSINMVSVARSAKGKEKADPDDDQPLEFKPEHHVSARKIKRNHRSRPNSGALIRMYARPEDRYEGGRRRDGPNDYHREHNGRGGRFQHSLRCYSRSKERR